jgi:UDP-GlcNAc:undecaprenyl-phosphate GlcNAc-1-phosphate transferase
MNSSFALKVLAALLVAAGISCALTPLVKWLARKIGAMDIPKDERRMHKKPTPRLGGLGIFVGFLVSFLIFGKLERELIGILLGAGLIVAIGILDDKYALRALPKFAVQIIAAVIVVAHGCRIEQFMGLHFPMWLSYTLSILWIVTITNAVNFIDGLDGLAAGVSAISAGTMLVVAMLLVPEPNAMLSAIVLAGLVGGCIGFIPYNFNPASIFMGDTGSTFLGFMLASVSIFGLFKTYAMISFAVPFLLLGLPIFDICFAVLRRISRGQSPMHADRGHVHHRLIDMGFSQKQAVAICYLISATLGLCAVVLADSGEAQALIVLAALLVIGTIAAKLIFGKHHKK